MLEVNAAQQIVLAAVKPLSPTREPLDRRLLGRLLAEEIIAPQDSPACDKSLRDGYAVRAADCPSAGTVLQVIGEIAAGAAPGAGIGPGQCQRIFTGAPLPAGADAVVMQEDVELLPTGHIRLRQGPVRPGQWVYPRGQEMHAGEAILTPDTRLTPAALGVLASLGRASVQVIAAPRVGIVATGNELLAPGQPGTPGKIYNSNGPLLSALLAALPLESIDFGILPDEEAPLRAGLERMLQQCHAIVIAGGMSVGDYDLVPRTLRTLGLDEHIRQVRMKPGKPFLFGRCGDRLVFGLPGNPVSAFVCCQLFVLPALRRLLGYAEADCYPPVLPARFREAFAASNDRPTYHPARYELRPTELLVKPLPWSGAPDLRALLAANALLLLPPGDVRYAPTDPASFIPLDRT
ncbi:molybdopterin molybdotransferase MoeA [Thermogemmata fonticola]|uniref:Molybdopterin molybdenumtransferase n=1 Tax=Thermogemmata fonticola TaxID=2755323 RepID=A0A7V8VE00_9BACT|nr:gephyrin-like molybdotransferase Glp [Thermogemmata fonticola]MBA2226211.1 molybdopterin molybdotransferase MoeA [Thermogemmata fonticola]